LYTSSNVLHELELIVVVGAGGEVFSFIFKQLHSVVIVVESLVVNNNLLTPQRIFSINSNG